MNHHYISTYVQLPTSSSVSVALRQEFTQRCYTGIDNFMYNNEYSFGTNIRPKRIFVPNDIRLDNEYSFETNIRLETNEYSFSSFRTNIRIFGIFVSALLPNILFICSSLITN